MLRASLSISFRQVNLKDVDNACLVTTKCVCEVLSPKSHLAEQAPRTPRTASQMHTIQAAQ